jgi:hypothetical protein
VLCQELPCVFGTHLQVVVVVVEHLRGQPSLHLCSVSAEYNDHHDDTADLAHCMEDGAGGCTRLSVREMRAL